MVTMIAICLPPSCLVSCPSAGAHKCTCSVMISWRLVDAGCGLHFAGPNSRRFFLFSAYHHCRHRAAVAISQSASIGYKTVLRSGQSFQMLMNTTVLRHCISLHLSLVLFHPPPHLLCRGNACGTLFACSSSLRPVAVVVIVCPSGI